jgi:hypothetical protein
LRPLDSDQIDLRQEPVTRLPPESRERKNYSVQLPWRKTSYAKFGRKVPETPRCKKLPVNPAPATVSAGGTSMAEKHAMKIAICEGCPVYLTKAAARFNVPATELLQC